MKRLALLLLLVLPRPALAGEDLVSGISQDNIEITSNYTGTDIVVFGAVEGQAVDNQAGTQGRDIVVVVRGPDTDITVRQKSRAVGVWVNRDTAVFHGLPAYYYLASTRPLAALASPDTLNRYGLGTRHLAPTAVASHHDSTPFRAAAVRLLESQGLYAEAPGGIDFLSATLFRARVPVPAQVARGQYSVDVYLLRGGDVIAAQSTPFFIDQTGVERRLFNFAHDHPFGYGVTAVLMALLFGWAASVLLRQPG